MKLGILSFIISMLLVPLFFQNCSKIGGQRSLDEQNQNLDSFGDEENDPGIFHYTMDSAAMDSESNILYFIDSSQKSLIGYLPGENFKFLVSGPQISAGNSLGIARGLAIHSQEKTAYTIDALSKNIIAIDLIDGDQTVLTGLSKGTGPPMTSPTAIALAGSKLLVADSVLGALVGVDLISGVREIISSDERGTGDSIQSSYAIAVNSDATIAYLSNLGSTVLEVDLVSGVRRTVTSPAMAGPPASNLRSLLIGKDGFSLFAYGISADGLLEIDIASGSRSLLFMSNQNVEHEISDGASLMYNFDESGFLLTSTRQGSLLEIDSETAQRNLLVQPNAGSGPLILEAGNFQVDPEKKFAVLMDTYRGVLLRINLTTGERESVFQGILGPTESSFGFLESVALTADGTLAYIFNSNTQELIQVNILTGTATAISTSGIELGPDMVSITDFILDDGGQNIYMLNRSETEKVLQVNLGTGIRSVISGSETGDGDPLSIFAATIAGLLPTNELLVKNTQNETLVAVNIANGDRRVVSGPDQGFGPSIGGSGGFMSLSEDKSKVVFQNYDGTELGLLEIDIATGQRNTLFFSDSESFQFRILKKAIYIGPNELLVYDERIRGLVRFDLTTRAREPVSR